jgi:hypothetical protein
MSGDQQRDLAPRLRSMLARGLTVEQALTDLRSETDNPLDAVKALRTVKGLSMSDALQALHALPVWSPLIEKVYRDTEAFFGEDQ